MNDYCLAALQKIQHSPQVTIVLVSKKSLKILKTPILKLKYVSILLFVAKAVTYFASRLHVYISSKFCSKIYQGLTKGHLHTTLINVYPTLSTLVQHVTASLV